MKLKPLQHVLLPVQPLQLPLPLEPSSCCFHAIKAFKASSSSSFRFWSCKECTFVPQACKVHLVGWISSLFAYVDFCLR